MEKFDQPPRTIDNKDKYVTHAELKLTEERLSNKIDHLGSQIDTKFAEQETNFFKNMLTIAGISIVLIGLLIKFLW